MPLGYSRLMSSPDSGNGYGVAVVLTEVIRAGVVGGVVLSKVFAPCSL